MQITKLQKTLIIIITILTCIMMSISISLYRAMYVNPNNIHVNYQTLKNDKIPEDLNDVSIVYFTDLQYGKFQNEQRTKNLFKQIYELSPDVVIFGGDLYDTNAEITDASNNLLIDLLSKIDAPLGKFAVMGEKDNIDENRINVVNTVYTLSQFEVLSDWNVRIGSQTGKSIRLIGLSPNSNFDQALANLSSEEYNLLISHYPDTLINERLATAPITYVLAGHSHGTQITYPIIGGYRKENNAIQLNRSQYKKLNFDYTISSGVGCTKINARLSAPVEIYHFILRH